MCARVPRTGSRRTGRSQRRSTRRHRGAAGARRRRAPWQPGPRGAPRDRPPRRAGTAEVTRNLGAGGGHREGVAVAAGTSRSVPCLARRRWKRRRDTRAPSLCAHTAGGAGALCWRAYVQSRRGALVQRSRHDRWSARRAPWGDQPATSRRRRIPRWRRRSAGCASRHTLGSLARGGVKGVAVPDGARARPVVWDHRERAARAWGARAAEPYGRRGGEEEDVATGQCRDGGAEPALGRTFEDARLVYAVTRYVSVWYAVPVGEGARF